MADDNIRKQVFLSYSNNDMEKASLLSSRLLDAGIKVVLDPSELLLGANFSNLLRHSIQSSDLILVLLSSSLFASSHIKFEYFQELFKQAKQRKVSVIPVLIEKCDIPSEFLEYEILNWTTNLGKGLDRLLQSVKTIQEVSFENLSGADFEEIIYDVLRAYGFKNIKREQQFRDLGVDFVADFFPINPFGQKKKERWMIEAKFYSESRFGLKNIVSIVDFFKKHNREGSKLLLITDSQINSVVEEFLEHTRRENLLDIEVIDGLLLKKLIANKRRILNKHILK